MSLAPIIAELVKRGEHELAEELVAITAGIGNLKSSTRAELQLLQKGIANLNKIARSLSKADKHMDSDDFELASKVLADMVPKLVTLLKDMTTSAKDLDLLRQDLVKK